MMQGDILEPLSRRCSQQEKRWPEPGEGGQRESGCGSRQGGKWRSCRRPQTARGRRCRLSDPAEWHAQGPLRSRESTLQAQPLLGQSDARARLCWPRGAEGHGRLHCAEPSHRPTYSGIKGSRWAYGSPTRGLVPRHSQAASEDQNPKPPSKHRD